MRKDAPVLIGLSRYTLRASPWVVLLALVLSACGGDVSMEEVARVTSPDRVFDAVLIETNAGATASFGYEVFVVRHAEPTQPPPAVTLYGATRNEQAYGANLRWQSARELAVEYLQAKTVKQTLPTVTVGDEKLTIVLRPGVSDPSAPPGGMAR